MTTGPGNISHLGLPTDQQWPDPSSATLDEAFRPSLTGSSSTVQPNYKHSKVHQSWSSDDSYESDSRYSSGTSSSKYEHPNDPRQWQFMSDNATEYWPSVSTISILDSEDEGTRPYSMKRIQRDFPSRWQQHPSGSAHSATKWHQHSLRPYYVPRHSSTPVLASHPVKAFEKHHVSSEKKPHALEKRVRWADDPRTSDELSRIWLDCGERQREYMVGRLLPDWGRERRDQDRQESRSYVVDRPPAELHGYGDGAAPAVLSQSNPPGPPFLPPVHASGDRPDRDPRAGIPASAMAGLTGSCKAISKVSEWRMYL